MIDSWIAQGAIADWLTRSTVLIALAWTAVLAARQLRAPAALRHLLWLLAIVSSMALPVLSSLMPVRVAVLPALAEAAPNVSSDAPSWSLIGGLWVVYVAGAAALLLRLVLGQLLLNAMWARARRVQSIENEAAAAAEVLGLRTRVAVRVADGASAPMTWGAVFPKIVLPATAADWPLAQRRLVLMHELAHVARADSATQLFASLTLAFAWFHPALWFAAAHLRREQEHACDERVLLCGAAPGEYAHALLEVAARTPVAVAATAVPMARSQLEARLAEIVRRRPRSFGLASAIVTTSGALAALAVAATLAHAAPPAAQPAHVAPVAARAAPAAEALPSADAEEADVADLADAPARPAHRATLTSYAPTSPLPPVPPVPSAAAIPALPASPAEPAALPEIPAPERHVCPRRAGRAPS